MPKQLQRLLRLFVCLSLSIILTFNYAEPVCAQPLLQAIPEQKEIVQFLLGFARQTFVSIYQRELHYEANEHPSEHLDWQIGHAVGRMIAKFLDPLVLDPLGADQ